MILIPTYNSKSFIENTIISAINQAYKTSVIIVDNCSTDNTINIAKKYNVEVIVNETNLGRIGNWNKCIEIAKQRKAVFFKILFAGDILKPNAMQKYKKIFEKYENVGLITSKYEIVNEEGKKLINQTIEKEKLISSKEAIELNLIKRNYYASPSIQAYKTKFIKDIKFNTNFPWAADWKFCIDLSKKCDVFYIDDILAEFHMENRKYYKSQANKLSSIAEEIYILSNLMNELNLNQTYEKDLKEMFLNKLVSRKELLGFLIKRLFK